MYLSIFNKKAARNIKTNVLMLFSARQTVYAGRTYQLKLFCSRDYPKRPPTVRFQTQINMSVVNQDTGMVGTASQYLINIIKNDIVVR